MLGTSLFYLLFLPAVILFSTFYALNFAQQLSYSTVVLYYCTVY